jgi:His/Glu/Gln/Arg/opine family amino acid ABC transporter permease subunit
MNFFDDFYNSIIYDNRYMYILTGIKNTLIMAFFAVILGIAIGLIISIINNYHKETRRLPILNWLGKFYVTIIRGTPTLVQLMILYYVVFRSVDVNVLLVGILAFGFNSGAYVSEIIRAGIDSIDVGQKEAGLALGLSYGQVMREIIIPQAIKNVLPALGNEFITLLKETSIGGYIGVVELTKASDIISSRTYNYFFPLLLVALIYLVLTSSLAKILKKLEEKLA